VTEGCMKLYTLLKIPY